MLDPIQAQLAHYVEDLRFDALPAEVVHAAKVRIIDALGALMGGINSPPAIIARRLAARVRHPSGATILGTRQT